MRPENGLWFIHLDRPTKALLGMGWFEDGRLRWSTQKGTPEAETLDRVLQEQLGEWVSTRPMVLALPPDQEPFLLSNPNHAGTFFMALHGVAIGEGSRLFVGYLSDEDSVYVDVDDPVSTKVH